MPDPTRDDVVQAIRDELDAIKVPGAQDAQPDFTWKQLDVDSLELVELVTSLEDRYSISISEGELKAIATVGDAADAVVALTQGSPATTG